MAKSHHGLVSKSAATGVAAVGKPMAVKGLGHVEGGAAHGPAGGGHGPASLGDVFGFTLAGGAVTAASFTLPSGTAVNMPLNTGVAYSVVGADVLATRSTTDATHLVRYSDTDADGLYEVIASSTVFKAAPQVNALGLPAREMLSVTQQAGVVTGVSQTRGDGSQKVLLSATVVPTETSWSLSNGLLVETQTRSNGQVHYEIFRDGNADGQFTEVASGTGAMIDLVGLIAQTDAFATFL
ncbi:MAG: hypothetical protein K9K38_09520 [Rhodoferax sp.]|nr:hypothetical protein [Rhodoferax sp.]